MPRPARIHVLSAVLGLLALCLTQRPVCAQDGDVEALRALLPKFEQQLSATPPAVDDLLAAVEAALAHRDPATRPTPEFVDALLPLADVCTSLGRAEQALRWLQPIDRALRDATEPKDRHRAAATLGRCLLILGRTVDGEARLRLAHDELATLPPEDPSLMLVRRVFTAALSRQFQWRECLPLVEQLVAADRAVRAMPEELTQDLARLGRCHHFLGQRQPALDAYEERLAIARSAWPENDERVIQAIEDLAAPTAQLGDYRGAYELSREALTIRERTESPDSDAVLRLKQNLSQLLVQLGELQTAHDLQAEVLERLAAKPDRDEHMYLTGLQYFARILHAKKDEDGAYTAIVEVIARLQASDVTYQRDLGTARTLLGVLERARGDLDASRVALEASFAGLSACLARDHNFVQIACGELISTCRLQHDEQRALDLIATQLDNAVASMRQSNLAARQTARLVTLQNYGIDQAMSLALDDVDAGTRRALAARVLSVSQMLRGAATQRARSAHLHDSERAEALARMASEIAAATRAGDETRIADLVRAKESFERSDPATDEPLRLPTPAELAAALPADAVAAAVVSFRRRRLDPTKPQGIDATDGLAAIVLHPDGALQIADIGDRNDLLTAVDELSAATHKKLRHLVLDPIRAVSGSAKVLFLVLDESLVAVPWDSLPTEAGAIVAGEVELRHVTSLLELLAAPTPPPPTAATARLLAIGGVDYSASDKNAATPRFRALPRSVAEVDGVATGFARAYPEAPRVVLRGDAATTSAIARALPGTSIAHFATHGFFASEQITSNTGSVGGGTLPTTAFELSPFALSGLALAGANAEPGADGASSGLLTAAEIQHLDFRSCYLVAVSACETALGAYSRGQGLASVREALHIAGARFVLSTLWPVDDAAAELVVHEFYGALWSDPLQPYRALYAAKVAARRAGLSFDDWAAFQLSGR